MNVRTYTDYHPVMHSDFLDVLGIYHSTDGLVLQLPNPGATLATA